MWSNLQCGRDRYVNRTRPAWEEQLQHQYVLPVDVGVAQSWLTAISILCRRQREIYIASSYTRCCHFDSPDITIGSSFTLHCNALHGHPHQYNMSAMGNDSRPWVVPQLIKRLSTITRERWIPLDSESGGIPDLFGTSLSPHIGSAWRARHDNNNNNTSLCPTHVWQQ